MAGAVHASGQTAGAMTMDSSWAGWREQAAQHPASSQQAVSRPHSTHVMPQG